MYIFKTTAAIKNYLAQYRKRGQNVGFVPTMGALHQGHLALVQRAVAENNCTVCSIFVNPTQFNNPSDLATYPRTTEADIELLLKQTACDALFLPPVDEIYPPQGYASPEIDLAGLDEPMEGAFRPGHFAGVVQVVQRLLDIVAPQHLYMGQKDFQQATIVRHMIQQLDLPVALELVPTQREADGLALSSRNQRLTPDQRQQAPAIYEALQAAQEALLHQQSLTDISAKALTQLTTAGLRPEYFTIVDGHTLQEIDRAKTAELVVACTAAWAGDVRLIDNMILTCGD